ncbi:hypothetical protein [Polaromonas naphthalenivorans]|uniref:Uncharacterized protein n=1 Tax=Polaromonas naphthalenivorans (strain CJ2) TaxID=365044 RepID=A1VWJ0_POLNA|nr:hypothetical protein [Polaromonas naphthalenivorans]ABM40018.1 hypothetical protein Pnap_4957 [Polaromonas naphthalenivorans CJ2]
MSNSYQVVTSIPEIELLNRRLAVNLKKSYSFQKEREVTSPAGKFIAKVNFQASAGTAIRAWTGLTHKDKLLNLFFVGEPRGAELLDIVVQLNFPALTYQRRVAGAFVKDQNGAVFVAHRGNLTKGNGALKKADVLREFSSQQIEAADNKQTAKLILISGLADLTLVTRLGEFADEARDVAIKLGKQAKQAKAAAARGGARQGATTTNPPRPGRVRATAGMKLQQYFDEYAGTGSTKGHEGGQRTVEHGHIVKALEAHQRHTGESQKAQAIDLAVVAQHQVNLFEVKTSAKTTDVYTGVGQLIIHGESICERLTLPVHRFLVLPEMPNSLHAKHIQGKAEVRIVTYQKVQGGYEFIGL